MSLGNGKISNVGKMQTWDVFKILLKPYNSTVGSTTSRLSKNCSWILQTNSLDEGAQEKLKNSHLSLGRIITDLFLQRAAEASSYAN